MLLHIETNLAFKELVLSCEMETEIIGLNILDMSPPQDVLQEGLSAALMFGREKIAKKILRMVPQNVLEENLPKYLLDGITSDSPSIVNLLLESIREKLSQKKIESGLMQVSQHAAQRVNSLIRSVHGFENFQQFMVLDVNLVFSLWF